MDDGKKPESKVDLEKLTACPVESVRPYALVMAPVFVHMKLNDKLLQVKGPLDFFTEKDLARFKPMGILYSHPEETEVEAFKKAAQQVRAAIAWDEALGVMQELKERRDSKKVQGPNGVSLPPSSFEVSDSVLRFVAPLWTWEQRVDPYYVTIFVNELCDAFPAESLKEWRDQSIELFEKAVFLSSWTVFLALHLGHVDLGFLNRLRFRVVTDAMSNAVSSYSNPEINELRKAASGSLGSLSESLVAKPGSRLTAKQLTIEYGQISQKLLGRMNRVGALAHV